MDEHNSFETNNVIEEPTPAVNESTVSDSTVNDGIGTSDSTGSSFDQGFDISSKKNKKSPLPFIAAGIVVVCVGASAAVVKVLSSRTDPKDEMEKNYNDLIDRETVYSQLAEQKLMESIANGEYTAEGDIKVGENNLADKLGGAELTFSNIMSAEQKKTSSDIMAKYNGVDLARVMMTCDDTTTRVHIPALFSESFSVENENVIGQLTHSPVLANYAMELLNKSGDISIKPFAMTDAARETYNLKNKIKELAKTAVSSAGDAFVYEKGEKTTAPNEEQVYSYTVTWPSDSVKTTMLDFLNGIKNSEEYKNALNAQIEYIYASKPDAAAQFGPKEEAYAQFDQKLDDTIKDVENSQPEDVVFTCMFVKDGIYFDMDQTFGGTNVKLNGEYSRTTKALRFDLSLEKDEKVEFNYNDNVITQDGIINENHSLNAASTDSSFALTSSATFDKENNALDGSASITADKDTISADYKAAVEKSEGKLQLNDVTVSLSAGDAKIDLSGSYMIKVREEDPRDINSSSEIKLSELNVMQAMQLYNEAKDNVGNILDVIK